MFTSQSGQIENALRIAPSSPDTSAKEMVQALANCQAPLHHRGNVAISRPEVQYFPGLAPAGAQAAFPQLNVKNISVAIPPWQTVPFTPIPYPNWPEWKDTQYISPPLLEVEGNVHSGPLATPSVQAGSITTGSLETEGDVTVGGDLTVSGEIRTPGTQGSAQRVGPSYSEVAHNYYTHNYGTTRHYGETELDGPTVMHGPTSLTGPVFIGGQYMEPFELDVITDVVWEDDALKVTKTPIVLIGYSESDTVATVVEGTACP